MKTLYLDLFSGISGDMFIGALIDLGVDARKLEHELAKLKLDDYHLHVTRKENGSIAGVKFDVHLMDDHDHEHGHGHHDHHHGHDHAHEHHHEHGHEGHDHDHDENRTFAEIKKLITKSRLSAWVKKKSIGVFQRIAIAEGKIHGMPPDKVHFHEVGAVDSIVDIVGGCIALDLLGKPRVLASHVTEGVGWVDCAHGRFPVPAPATLAILGARGVGVTQCDEPHELVTPTGAALVAELAESFGPMQGIVAEKVGFGLGTRVNKTRPNVLRAILGKPSTSNVQLSTSKSETRNPKPEIRGLDWETDRVEVLETNLDDINAEILGDFMERVRWAGALDIFHTPVQMKKNRPGVLLTVVCGEGESDRFAEMILQQTTAFGVRRTVAERRKLRREFVDVKTKFGRVSVKIGRLGGKLVQAAPEYESCRKLAEKAKVPVKLVYEAAANALKR